MDPAPSPFANNFFATLEDSFKINMNKLDGKCDGQGNQQAASKTVAQATDKGLGDNPFRKNDHAVPFKANDGKNKGFLAEIKSKQQKGPDSEPSKKKTRFLSDMAKSLTPSVEDIMDQDDNFRQMINKIKQPQFLNQGNDDSAKNFNYGDDFPAKSSSEVSKQDISSSFRADEAPKNHYDKEPTMEENNMDFGADFEDNDYQYPRFNANKRAKESRASHGRKSDHGQQKVALESAGLINKTLSTVFNKQREITEHWGKLLTKSEACEIKLLERGNELLSEAKIMREKYEEQKEKFKRKLSVLNNVLTKSSK